MHYRYEFLVEDDMQFIDEATISVEAGHGGRGHKSFRREAFVPLGGPDGGDGGLGGSVYVVADSGMHTLLDFRFRPKWKAEDGSPGEACNRSGRSGEDIVIRVPLGTQVFNQQGELVVDLVREGDPFLLAKGGRGGKGNAFFKSPTNRAPEHTQPGEAGESGGYKLSLKLVADVGLIGFPNAGKSTLISRVSAARPKIADYPFTTLTPHLGVARSKSGHNFVIADIPGLIPGASEGRGLGITFLKHIERTRLLMHLIDLQGLNESGELRDPEEAHAIIQKELHCFSDSVSTLPQFVVLTKIDALADQERVKEVADRFKARGIPVYAISAVSGVGVEELMQAAADYLRQSGSDSRDDGQSSGK